MNSTTDRSRGFTLPELLVTLGVAVILLVAAATLLRPKDYASDRRDAQRWTAIAALVQAITKYKADNGRFPAGLTASPQTIGSIPKSGDIDLCGSLVPRYMPNLLFDPTVGGVQVSDASATVKNCLTTGIMYSTGYTVALSKANRLTIAAPAAEMGQNISLNHQY